MPELHALTPPTESLSRKEGGKERKNPRLRRYLGGVVVGALINTGVAIDVLNSADGQHRYYPAATEEWLASEAGPLPNPETEINENELRVASYNVESKLLTEDIGELIERHDLDVVNLQEVKTEHADRYAEYFNSFGWDVIFGIAEGFPKPNKPKGMGNLMALRHRPTNFETLSLGGHHPLVWLGYIPTEDHVYTQENRSVIIATFKKGDIEYVVMDSHISQMTNSEMHLEQLAKLTRLIHRHTKEGRLTVACADYNNSREKILAAINDDKNEVVFDAPETGRTSVNYDKEIDHCVFNEGVVYEGGAMQVIKAEALTESKSDHYPIVVVFGGFEEDKPAATLSNLPDFPSPGA